MFCIYMNVLSKIYELIIQILSFFWNDLQCTSVFYTLMNWACYNDNIRCCSRKVKDFSKKFQKWKKSQIAP